MFSRHIGATGVAPLTDGDDSYVSCVEFTLVGFTGSLVPQLIQQTDNTIIPVTLVYNNCAYINADTRVAYTAGTAITGDGRFLVETTGAKLGLNVTNAGDGDFYVCGKPYLGSSLLSSSGGGGGGGGAVTVADGADVTQGSIADAAVIGDNPGTENAHLRGLTSVLTGTVYNSTDGLLRIELVKDSTPIPTTALPVSINDPTLAFTMPTGDVASRGIFMRVTDGTNQAAVKAASTAVVATDPALVVALSQNSAGVKVTDGTNTAAVKAASTAAATTDPAVVTAISPNSYITVGSTLTALATALPVVAALSTFDGTNQRRLNSANSATDGSTGTNTAWTGISVWNNTTGPGWDRARASTADGISLGIPAAGVFGFNGTNNDRIRGSAAAGLVVKQYALPASDVIYTAPSGGITNTTAVTLAAALASNKTYITTLQLSNSGAAGTEVIVRRATGAVVIWRGYVGPATSSLNQAFANPLASATNDALELVLSSGTTVAVYVNAQGYTAA